jgi:Ca-activated chloride channel family protein
MELDEKKYLYFLYTLVLLFCIIYIGKEKQREFGDLEMVKKLSPESSVFKPVLKLEYCFWR